MLKKYADCSVIFLSFGKNLRKFCHNADLKITWNVKLTLNLKTCVCVLRFGCVMTWKSSELLDPTRSD